MKRLILASITLLLLSACMREPTPLPAGFIQTAIAGTFQAGTAQAPLPSDTPIPNPIETPSEIPVTPTKVSNPDLPPGAECVPKSHPQTLGVVTRIIDGDTIEVLLDDGKTYQVRYIGMDTPERGDPFFEETTTKNQELLGGGVVTMVKDVSETDRYDRLLRYIFTEQVFVNLELVKQGYAQAATYPPDVACAEVFLESQRTAQESGIGLWPLMAFLQPSRLASEPTSPGIQSSGAPPPGAGGGVIIQDINYDGEVPMVESDEYAEIANLGGDPVDLEGWRLNAGYPGQDFIFPSYLLSPGETCRVYTNEYHPETCGFSFQSDQAIWNNKGDCGYLYNALKQQVSMFCY